MQKFDIADGGSPTGEAVDRVGLVAGTTYFAKYWNDNFFNIFNAVEKAGYSLIDDDLEQLHKAMKGLYVATYTYNTSAIATQTVNDVVLGSDGKYYEAQDDAVTGDDPVGSVTGDWLEVAFDKGVNPLFVNLTTAQTINGVKTFSSFPFTPSQPPFSDYHMSNKKYVDDGIAAISVGGLSIEDFLHIQDQKTSGTQGGSSVAGLQTRTLNTILKNTISGASLSVNLITLPAGDYYIESSATCYRGNTHKTKIYNQSDAANIIEGNSENANSTSTVQTTSFCSGTFTLAAEKDISLRHFITSANATNGLGVDVGDGFSNVFADVRIWKVG